MKGTTMDRLILAGDIGGTNTNLALVRCVDRRFEVLHSARFSTKAETSLVAPMERFFEALREQGFGDAIETCCISAAGPVKNDAIQLTNAPWGIAAPELAARFGMRVHLINDFTAISYAVALIDADDQAQLAHIPHRDGSTPYPGEGIALVVGAGTGLGVAQLVHQVHPIGFADFLADHLLVDQLADLLFVGAVVHHLHRITTRRHA